MSFREIIPFVLAAVGGIGGLANALAGMEIVDALNTNRPTDDQIPNPPLAWNGVRLVFEKSGIRLLELSTEISRTISGRKIGFVAKRGHLLDGLFFHCRCLHLCKGALSR
jgi:hypothetical protein